MIPTRNIIVICVIKTNRPECPEFAGYFNREIEDYGLRHRVKPGLTGLAQVSFGFGEGLEGAVVK